MRTRVGYAGGTTKDPTYQSIGDHAETIQIDFDPEVVSYRRLAELFFASHNPCSKPWSRQYMSAAFYANEQQRQILEDVAAEVLRTRRHALHTEIAPLDRFYLAEDYHQKYRLRADRSLAGELSAIYPGSRQFVDSTAAARLNGYLGGHGERAQFEREISQIGLSASAQEALRVMVGRRLR